MTTEEQDKLIAELKAKYGTVYTLSLPMPDDSGKTVTIFLRKMDRLVYKTVSALIQKESLMGVESLLRQLYIGGDNLESIINDFDLLRSAESTIVELLQAKQGELKKN